MRKRIKIQALVFFLCICTIVSSLPGAAIEISEDTVISAEMNVRKQNIFTELIAEMEQNHLQLHEEEGEISLNISAIKDVHDFAGNHYTLAELEPTGYILFHDESGVFIEYSSRALSPYLGLYDELYYAGPQEYYSKTSLEGETEYRHTVMDKTLNEDDVIVYEEASDKLNGKLVAETNQNIVSYIKNNTPLYKNAVSSQIGQGDSVQDKAGSTTVQSTTATYKGMTCINNYTFFTRLNQCGDNENDTCGYTAAGMLLAYWKYTKNANYIPTDQLIIHCLNGIAYPQISRQLSLDLYNVGQDLGYSNSTTSRSIRFTVNKYLENRGMTTNWKDEYIPIGNNFVIIDQLSSDRPVIWFGEIFGNTHDDSSWIAHAVVVYGYSQSITGFSYIAHFGWDTATEVYFSGVVGSMYTCWP